MSYTLSNIRTFGLVGIATAAEDMTIPLNVFIIVTLAMAIVSYLLGSLNFAIIISKFKYHDDIRRHGSGNAGATNMIRTYGTGAGVFTFLGDLMKAIVAVLLTEILMGEVSAYVAGVACVLGHVFPVWYKFKGGKGVAVSAAMMLATEPIVFLVIIIVFIAVVAVTKYISLGSIMAALMYPLVLMKLYPFTHINNLSSLFFIIMICSVTITLLVLYMHRENMQRLLNRTENKFSFKKKGSQNKDEEK